MSRPRHLSIRVTLGLLTGVMGLMLIAGCASGLVDAWRHQRESQRVSRLIATSRPLFNALVSTRFERGMLTSGLVMDAVIDTPREANVAANRKVLEDGLTNALAGMAGMDLPGLAGAVRTLQSAHEAVDALRPAVDAAVRQPKAARDPSLAKRVPVTYQQLADAVGAAEDIVEASLRMVDPVLDQLLLVKRSAWSMRLTAGSVMLRIETGAASGQPWTAADTLASAEERGRILEAAGLLAEAVTRAGTPPPVADGFATLKSVFLDYDSSGLKQYAAALSEGRKPDVPMADLARRNTAALAPIGDLAKVALRLAAERAGAQAARAQDTLILYAVMLAVAVACTTAGFLITSRLVSRPLQRITQAMLRLAGGDTTVAIPGTHRRDEIGSMAGAVQVFKDNAISARAMEAEQAASDARRMAEDETIRREAEQAAAREAAALVVGSIGLGLERLAAGDLSFRVGDGLPAAYAKLGSDLNATTARLQELVRSIVVNTSAISTGTGEIAHASDDLSRRTENQAASLEQTAAALDQITATVRQTADGARQAHTVVASTRADAIKSGEVVRQAVMAMGQIEQSSQKISEIIGVVDEIAFQTNLLALNAGVEAARAGDAGRGFAVVASEVRALAQRSTQAAREIKGLISTSAQQVSVGVQLVGETGQALGRIVTQVNEVTSAVSAIAASAQEQATGLLGVNTAINEMDKVTQQNAAMVEQSSAACQSLALETAGLVRLTEQFQLAGSSQATALPGPSAKAQPHARQRLKSVAR